MSYNFHIGQDVVALINHSQGVFKKDDLFTIIGLRKALCKCNMQEVNIGIKIPTNYSQIYYDCRCCNTINIPKQDSGWWFAEECFAPLNELTDISELQEVLEQPLFQVK